MQRTKRSDPTCDDLPAVPWSVSLHFRNGRQLEAATVACPVGRIGELPSCTSRCAALPAATRRMPEPAR